MDRDWLPWLVAVLVLLALLAVLLLVARGAGPQGAAAGGPGAYLADLEARWAAIAHPP